jgi:hypothetical protein
LDDNKKNKGNQPQQDQGGKKSDRTSEFADELVDTKE